MMLTSTLTIIGVVIMMISISPLLAIITLITVPVSLVAMELITTRSKKKFIAQWRYTGTLNAQVEEAFTGHALVSVFGQQDEVAAHVRRAERGALPVELRRAVHLRARSSPR